MKKLLILTAALALLCSCKVKTVLTLIPDEITVKVGETRSLQIQMDGDAQTVTSLQSENPSIASAYRLNVTGESVGNTRVFAQEFDADNKVVATAYCDVTVIE